MCNMDNDNVNILHMFDKEILSRPRVTCDVYIPSEAAATVAAAQQRKPPKAHTYNT